MPDNPFDQSDPDFEVPSTKYLWNNTEDAVLLNKNTLTSIDIGDLKCDAKGIPTQLPSTPDDTMLYFLADQLVLTRVYPIFTLDQLQKLFISANSGFALDYKVVCGPSPKFIEIIEVNEYKDSDEA